MQVFKKNTNAFWLAKSRGFITRWKHEKINNNNDDDDDDNNNNNYNNNMQNSEKFVAR